MSYLLSLFKAVGDVVDKVVPAAHGLRTKIAVVACPVLGYVAPYVPAEYKPVVTLVQGALCAAAPLFAVAGLVRDKK